MFVSRKKFNEAVERASGWRGLFYKKESELLRHINAAEQLAATLEALVKPGPRTKAEREAGKAALAEWDAVSGY